MAAESRRGLPVAAYARRAASVACGLRPSGREASLAAPQIARRLTGHGASVDLTGAAIVGAVLLLGADLAAQHAIPGVLLPTGAVTVCFGGAYLLVLLVRESRRSA